MYNNKMKKSRRKKHQNSPKLNQSMFKFNKLELETMVILKKLKYYTTLQQST